jgi:hypothetical protein
MTAWITLIALTVLFALSLRHGRSEEPPMPPGYDAERQLAEPYGVIRSALTMQDLSKLFAPTRSSCDLFTDNAPLRTAGT